MAPVVHGLAKDYEGRVDFLYLDVSDPRNKATTKRLGFIATPHFFFLQADGSKIAEMKGVVPRDTVIGALNALLVSGRR